MPVTAQPCEGLKANSPGNVPGEQNCVHLQACLQPSQGLAEQLSMPYVTDAHPLIWHFTRDPRLSPKALEIFRGSAAGKEVIIVPTIVLGEILYVSEAGRTPAPFQDVLSRIEEGDNYEIAALDLHVLKAA
ncbi:MAG: hypothetical protein WBW48_02325 [Anaerolineae bacterium]